MAEEKSLQTSKRPWWMTTGGREPWGDVWFERLWPEWSRLHGGEYRTNFDVYEKDGTYYLEADLPGVNKDDVSINVDRNLVTVSGKRASDKEEKGKNYYVRESSCGSFSRSFHLPYEIDEANVDATLKDGVLTVGMPPKESGKSRKIKVKG